MEGDEVNEEEIVDEFKRFLDKVSAEDFAEAEVEVDDLADSEDEAEDGVSSTPTCPTRAVTATISASRLKSECRIMPG